MKNKSTNLKKRFVRNAFWSFLSAGINRLGLLVFSVIIARLLMPEGYGLYSIVLSVAMIFFIFADLGINNTLTRYVSSALATDKRKIPGYYRYLLKIKFFITLFVSIALLLIAYPLAFFVYNNSSLFLPFLIASLYIFVLAFEGFYMQLFYAAEKVQYLTLREILNQILRISLVIIVFYALSSDYHVSGIYLSLILNFLILVLFNIFYLRKIIPNIFHKSGINIDKKRVKRFVGFITLASISSVFFSHIDSLMLGFFLKPEFVGYYRAGFSIILSVIGLILFPNAVLLPILTKINEKTISSVFNQIFRYFSIIIIPSIFGLFILGKYFIRFFYGYSYLPAVLPFYFLVILIFPAVFTTFFVSLFSAREKPEIFAKLIVFTTIINIVLNFVLIKSLLTISEIWATSGAAIATLLSWTFYFIFAFYKARKEFNLLPSYIPALKSLISSMIMGFFLIFTLPLINDMTLFTGMILVLAGAAIYLIFMFLIKGIERQDLNLLKNLIKNEKTKA
jgi:O-antigen/teichoic acid export membrane protein